MPVTLDNVHDVVSYHSPSQDQIDKIASIRLAAEVFITAILENTPGCADQAASVRLARESMMTANAAIVLNGKV